MFASIGEAANPGPFVIGTSNPTGALGKAHLFQELPGADQSCIWGLSETHLTRPGVDKFRLELKMQPAPWKYVCGAAAPPLSQAQGTIGGKATGVGVLTTCPARPLANAWPTSDWASKRLQAAAVCVQQQWVKIGTFYGYAKDAHTKATKDRSDELLANLTQRIVMASKGYRAIVGDFNSLTADLAQFAIWRSHGFQEIQEIANHRWQREIQPTCKGNSVKDHVWISPELAEKLLEVHTDDTYFADHAILYATFSDLGRPEPVPIWIKPKPIQCEQIPQDAVDEFDGFADHLSFQQVFAALEDAAHYTLQKSGDHGLIPPQRGRCTTVKPTIVRAPITPIGQSRKHDFQTDYQGENYQHTKWCRQLRRLQSYRALAMHDGDTPATQSHKSKLWLAIRAATGFPQGFPKSWAARKHRLPGEPATLPKLPPDAPVAKAIYLGFLADFRALEKALMRHRRSVAVTRRSQNPNLFYADVAKPRAIPVQTVVTKTIAHVTETANDGTTIKYSPPEFQCDLPVESQEGLVFVNSHTPGELQLSHTAQLEPGDALYQSKLVGDRSKVFAAFVDLWKPMWTKHQNAPPAHWDHFVDQLTATEGASSVMPWPAIQAEDWISAVRTKRSRTATGPDGISRLDLLHMPPRLVAQLVAHVNEFDLGVKPWPQPALVGHISNVEKCPDAAAPQQFRPITVLTLPYRVWASIRARQCLSWLAKFAPDGMHGNIPGKSTVGVWWSLALQIEAATQQGRKVSGFLTDLTKAFNNLPRPVVYACAIHYGLPISFVRSWHQALSSIRHFVVAGATSGPVWSSNGYPEGDPLSVVAMVLVNLTMHIVVATASPLAQVLTFVDNWEGVCHEVSSTCATFAAMEEFAISIDLQLDQKKTIFWANNADDRKALRQLHKHVILHGSDLGGHLNYSRRMTNYSSRARIDKLAAFWGALARSPAPIEQKLRAIATVAWPRSLHGISGVALAGEHFGRLRAHAMACLKWNKKGASSVIQFGLGSPKIDPGFIALLDTVLTFRNHGVPDVAYPVLSGLVGNPPRHFDPGPCGVFLARLHEVQWRWEGNGFLLDHEGLPVHLLDSPIQYLKLRLRQAWEKQVGATLHDRKDFSGLIRVDAELSRTIQANTGEERGIIRSVQNGTFYTRDKQIHTGKIPTKDCPFCHLADGLQHRIWECEAVADLRQTVPYRIREFLDTQPDCTRFHAWMVEDWTDFAWRKTLVDLRDASQDVRLSPPDEGTVHLFTDGGCLFPSIPRFRLASWAFCVASLVDGTFLPGASGLLEGPFQTSLRAEIRAAIEAIQYAILHRRKFLIWTDNQHVYKRIKRYASGRSVGPGVKHHDHDLWTKLFLQVRRAKHLFVDVVKVVSHMDIHQVEGSIDKWVVCGNATADRLATEVLQQLPMHMKHTLEIAHAAWVSRKEACEHLQRFFVAMGQRAIAAKETIREGDVVKWEEVGEAPQVSPEMVISLVPFPDQIVEVAEHSLGPRFQPLLAWVRGLISGDHLQPMWLSSYQLLIHFQSTTGMKGFWYDRPNKRWLLADDYAREHGFEFCQFSAWLISALKVFAKAYQLPLNVQSKLPWGTCFRSWQRCILLRTSVTAFTHVDTLLRERGIVAAKTVTGLKTLEDFCERRV